MRSMGLPVGIPLPAPRTTPKERRCKPSRYLEIPAEPAEGRQGVADPLGAGQECGRAQLCHAHHRGSAGLFHRLPRARLGARGGGVGWPGLRHARGRRNTHRPRELYLCGPQRGTPIRQRRVSAPTFRLCHSTAQRRVIGAAPGHGCGRRSAVISQTVKGGGSSSCACPES